MLKYIKNIFFVIILFFAFAENILVYADIEININENGLGKNVVIETSGLPQNENIKYKFYFPVGADISSISLDDFSDKNGNSKIEIYSKHTQKAGIYKIEIFDKEKNILANSKFKLETEAISIVNSFLFLDKNLAKINENDLINAKIFLVDKFGNPIENKYVRVLSSRDTDKISVAKKTNDNGIAKFDIKSNFVGNAKLFAEFKTSDKNWKKIDEKEIMFAKNINFANSGNSDDNPVVSTQSDGPVDHFEIGEIASEVETGEAYDFSVKAVDSDNEIVTVYQGTITIEVSDENASFSDEYTFKETELGTHNFALGIKFATAGTHTIKVYDSLDPTMQGEFSVTVVESTKEDEPSPEEILTPVITSPQSGEKTNEQSINIKGTANANAKIAIFDGMTEIVSDANVDSEGNFEYLVENLSDGEHSFSVMSLPQGMAAGPVSSDVIVEIDSTKPLLSAIKIEHAGEIKSDDIIVVKVNSEENLKRITIKIDNQETELVETEYGEYTASLPAPSSSGDYSVDLILLDTFENSNEILKATSFTVVGESVVENNNTLPKLESLEIESMNNKVNLNWSLSSDDTIVDHVKIYYGTDKNNLSENKSTNGYKESYTIDGLRSNQKYYFKAVSVDKNFKESEDSAIVSATIKGEEDSTGDNTDRGDDTDDSGMGTTFALITALSISIIFGIFQFVFKKE